MNKPAQFVLQAVLALLAGSVLIYAGTRNGGIDDATVTVSRLLSAGFLVASSLLSRVPGAFKRRPLLFGVPTSLFVFGGLCLVFGRSIVALGIAAGPIARDYCETIADRALLVGAGLFGLQLVISVWRCSTVAIRTALCVVVGTPSVALLLLGYGS